MEIGGYNLSARRDDGSWWRSTVTSPDGRGQVLVVWHIDGFNYLLEMPRRRARGRRSSCGFWFQFSIGDAYLIALARRHRGAAGFNSLLEMLSCSTATEGYLSSSFNSLLEMQLYAHFRQNRLYLRISILYWRCKHMHDADVQHATVSVSILYWRCERRRLLSGVRRKIGFNSLLEMRRGAAARGGGG